MAALAFAVWRYMAIVGHSVQRRQAFLAARRGEPGGTPGAVAKPSATARFMALATRQSTLVVACFLAVLVPRCQPFPGPKGRSFLTSPWPKRRLRRARFNRCSGGCSLLSPLVHKRPQTPTPAPTSETTSETSSRPARPQDATVVGVLLAAKSKDWKALDERLALMKAAAPASDPNEIQALNDKAKNLMRRDENERAAEVLARVVMLDPERPTAWANLTEVLTAQDAGLHALRVAVRLSTNRAKTVDYLRQAQENPPSENFAKLAAAVLLEIDQIPRHPKDTSDVPP